MISNKINNIILLSDLLIKIIKKVILYFINITNIKKMPYLLIKIKNFK